MSVPNRPSQPPQAQARLRVVHPVLPFLLTVLCLGIAVRLVPDKHELAKRQLKDGSRLRGLTTAMDLGNAPEDSAPAQIDEGAAERALASALADPAELQVLATSAEGRATLAEGVLLNQDPRLSMTELSERSQILSQSDHEELLRCVARRAINRGQPKVADLIFTKFFDLRPETMSQEMVEDVVRSWRANSQAVDAVACLKTWIAHAQSMKQEVPEHLQEMYVNLLIETNQASAALDLLLDKLAQQRQPTGKISSSLLATAIEAGNYSGRVKELRPYLAEAVASMPLGQASLEDICAAVKAQHHPLLHEQSQWSKSALELAHWYEWAETPDPNNAEHALALYEKLAALGNREGLEKAVEMATDLQTTGNLLKVLDVVMHQPEPPALELEYGHQLGVAGRLEEANDYFQAWLQRNPEDLAALAEYASLCQERDDLPKALAIWKTSADLVERRHTSRSQYWLALHQWYLPGDYHVQRMDYRKRQAELHIELQQNAHALAIYQLFQAHQHDNTTLENMALLAESLGDYPSLNHALAMRFQKLSHYTVNDYLELARSFSLIGQEEQRMEILEQGVAKLPQSLNLRRQYAGALMDSERPGEAVDLLDIASTKTDLRSMSLYIVSAVQSGQYNRAAEFLKGQIGKRRDFPADVRLNLGHICQQTKQFDLARGYYSSVDSNAVTWPLLAEACFQTEAYHDAEKYQLLYLDDIDTPPADQLIFLGDIQRMLGKEEAAQIAYDRAVESIRSKHKADIQPPTIPKISTSFSQ